MSEERLDALERQVAGLSNELQLLRDREAIRKLHFTYGYCMDKWLFDDIVELFAEDCELRFLDGIWRGKEGARRVYNWTDGVKGPQDGMLGEHVIAQDVVHVAEDRSRAWGRFRVFLACGVHENYQQNFPDAFSPQFWEGGVHENEYVLEDGVWKIALFNYRINFQAHYEDGWKHSPDGSPIMVAPFRKTYPELPNGPDELRPMPPQWPQNTVIPFHYDNPVTGRKLGAGVGGD